MCVKTFDVLFPEKHGRYIKLLLAGSLVSGLVFSWLTIVTSALVIGAVAALLIVPAAHGVGQQSILAPTKTMPQWIIACRKSFLLTVFCIHLSTVLVLMEACQFDESSIYILDNDVSMANKVVCFSIFSLTDARISLSRILFTRFCVLLHAIACAWWTGMVNPVNHVRDTMMESYRQINSNEEQNSLFEVGSPPDTVDDSTTTSTTTIDSHEKTDDTSVSVVEPIVQDTKEHETLNQQQSPGIPSTANQQEETNRLEPGESDQKTQLHVSLPPMRSNKKPAAVWTSARPRTRQNGLIKAAAVVATDNNVV